MVVDNINDLVLLISFLGFFPLNRKGSIFFITRNYKVAVRLSAFIRNIVIIGEINKAKAFKLL